MCPTASTTPGPATTPNYKPCHAYTHNQPRKQFGLTVCNNYANALLAAEKKKVLSLFVASVAIAVAIGVAVAIAVALTLAMALAMAIAVYQLPAAVTSHNASIPHRRHRRFIARLPNASAMLPHGNGPCACP